jgi:hypothetical protein
MKTAHRMTSRPRAMAVQVGTITAISSPAGHSGPVQSSMAGSRPPAPRLRASRPDSGNAPIACPRFEQRARQRRHPADAAARRIGFVHADDLVGAFDPLLRRRWSPSRRRRPARCSRAAGRIDDLRQIEAPGQEADAPVDLAQPPLAIDVVGVFRAVAVAGRPLHDADHLRPLDAQQMIELVVDARVPAGRDVVAGALRQAEARDRPLRRLRRRRSC